MKAARRQDGEKGREWEAGGREVRKLVPRKFRKFTRPRDSVGPHERRRTALSPPVT
jgi:hypothetical protein